MKALQFLLLIFFVLVTVAIVMLKPPMHKPVQIDEAPVVMRK